MTIVLVVPGTDVSASPLGTTVKPSAHVINQTLRSAAKTAKNKSESTMSARTFDENLKHSSVGQVIFAQSPHMWNGKQGWAAESVSFLDQGSKVFGIKLLTTNDGGTTWMNAGPKVHSLYGLQQETGSFYSPLLGWFVELAPDHGFVVQRTTDGGTLWKSSSSIPTHLGDGGIQIDRVSKGIGYIVIRDAGMTNPPSELYQTTDGGTSWKLLRHLPISGTIDFSSRNDGWLAGANNTPDPLLRANTGHGGRGYTWLYETTDGGRRWKHIELPIPNYLMSDHTDVGYPIFRGEWGIVTVTFFSSTGTNSVQILYVTNDDGRVWTPYRIPQGAVADVQFVSPSLGFLKSYIPGKTATSPETLEWFRTRNGGRTWSRLNISLPSPIRMDASIRFSTSTNWWAVTQTELYRTTNQGKSWVQVPIRG